MAQLSFVICSETPEFGECIREMLACTGHADVKALVCDADELAETLREQMPDAALVDLGHAPHLSLDRLASLSPRPPQLVVCGPQSDSGLLLRAMQAGVSEFLSSEPDAEEMGAAVERMLLQPHRARAASRAEAPVIGVMGAKGGAGATLVACQLAASLQALGGRTVLLDLNLPLGDVALHFDLQPSYSLADVAREGVEIDATYLSSVLQVHRTGVQVLASPQRVEDAELVRAPHVTQVVASLRQSFDWVVIDVSRSWSEASVCALDLAQEILLVTLRDIPTLSHAKKHLELLRRLGHGDAKIHPVANRHARGDAVSDRDLEQFLGRPADASIPNDYAASVDSVTQGRPLGEVAPRSEIHRAFEELARSVHRWCGVPLVQEDGDSKLSNRIRRMFRT